MVLSQAPPRIQKHCLQLFCWDTMWTAENNVVLLCHMNILPLVKLKKKKKINPCSSWLAFTPLFSFSMLSINILELNCSLPTLRSLEAKKPGLLQ